MQKKKLLSLSKIYIYIYIYIYFKLFLSPKSLFVC